MKKLIFVFTLMLIAGLALSACSTALQATTQASNPAAATSQPTTSVPTATEPAAPTAAGSCLIGDWNLTDFSSYMNSIQQNAATSSGAAFTITSQNFTGSAKIAFNSDNTAKLSADNFVQKFDMLMAVNGQNMDIPISMTINGASTAQYSVDGDKISFSNQDQGDLQINVDTMGITTVIDQGLMGNPGTIQLYQYACTDANTLSLKVIATNQDLAPLILTRVR